MRRLKPLYLTALLLASYCSVFANELVFKNQSNDFIVEIADTSFKETGSVQGIVASKDSQDRLAFANIVFFRNGIMLNLGASTSDNGEFFLQSVPVGKYQLHFSFLGYKTELIDIIIIPDSTLVINAELIPEALIGTDVEVTALVAKHEVSIGNTPERIEVMVPEEVQDKIAFAADIKGALSYSGGVFVNQSKDIYESENLRLRGIDGRYLLLLRDQTMLLGYEPEDAGIWTIPLVGVKQIEIVKGDYSALYGFGNAGVINTVMRTPFSDTLNFFGLARINSENEPDASFYIGHKFGKFGLSTLAGNDYISSSGSGMIRRYSVLPRIDYQNGTAHSSLSGVLLKSIDSQNNPLYNRIETNFKSESRISPHLNLLIQAQYAQQEHDFMQEINTDKTHSQLYYSSLEIIRNAESMNGLIGIDGYYENWDMPQEVPEIYTKSSRIAAYLRTEWNLNPLWSLLYGGRVFLTSLNSSGPIEYYGSSDSTGIDHADYDMWGTNQLFAVLFKQRYDLSYRLSLGLSTVPPLSHYLFRLEDNFLTFVPASNFKAEHMVNSAFDIKLLKKLGPIMWTGDISLFLIQLRDHLDVYALNEIEPNNVWKLRNSADYIIKGVELFSRFDFGDDLAVLYGYTFIEPNEIYNTSQGTMLPLPRHQANFEIDWEIEATGIRVEVESKFVGEQKTPGNPYRGAAPPYCLWGATLEYTIHSTKIFIGSENITNFHQTDNGPLWAPSSGRELYAGLKASF